MAQLLQGESAGGRIGSALGTGIGSGLTALANQKMQELATRQQQAQQGKFWQELGLPASIGTLPPQVQKGLLDRLEGVNFGGQQGGMQAMQQMQPGQEQVQQGPTIGANPIERRHREQQALGQKKLDIAERKEAREYLTPFNEKHLQTEKSIRSNNQLIQLARSGNLRAGYKQKLLDKLDLGNFWQPIENELAQKNLARQATNAGSAFNTRRLTNLEVGTYKQSLATLWNTPQGIESVARTNNLEFKAEEERYKERIKIIKENNGAIPFDIESQVEDRIQPKLKHYADKAMKIVTNAINKIPGKNVAKRKGLFNAPIDVPTQGLIAGQSKITNDKTGETLIWNGTGWGTK